MIAIRTILPTHNILTKGSIHSKKDIQPMTTSLDWKKKEIELVDNFMGTKQSVYELCTILDVDISSGPIMFFEKLKQLQLRNDAIEKRNKESQAGN